MKEGHWTATFQRNPSWPTVRITRAEAINGPDFTIELTNLGSVLHNLRNREQLFPCKFHHCTSAIELDSTQNSVDMASIIRSKSVLSVLFINLFLSLVSSAVAVSSGSGDGFSISGRVKLPGMSLKAFGSPGGKASNVKVVLNGGEHVTFLRPDGYFSFQNMSAGTHLIEVAAIGYFFSPVRVDVSARHPGKVQAALTETRRGLNELVLEPLREEQYYEIREPFSIMSLVKSPMGLMMGFMLVVVFLMPKLMENMDPEEMRRAQEEMRSQGVPSLANLIPGAGRS